MNIEPDSTAANAVWGCVLGAIAGPCACIVAIYIMALLFPHEEVGPFLLFAVFILSIPDGAIAGAILGAKMPGIISFIKSRFNR